MNGNWSEHDMTSSFGASRTQAALALTALWAIVTVGRLLFATVGRWLPSPTVFEILPLLLVGTPATRWGTASPRSASALVDHGVSLPELYGWAAVAAAAMALLAWPITRRREAERSAA